MPAVLTGPYGNYWSGDALYNIRVGHLQMQVSYRFIATRSAVVNQIRHYNVFSAERPGYHLGTGGKIRIELCANDVKNGNVPGSVLATALLPAPLTSTAFPLSTFNRAVPLTVGQIYHILFTNYDAKPLENHVSVNTMSVLKPRESTSRQYQREVTDTDMTVLIKNTSAPKWTRFRPDLVITPIFTLFYSDGGARQVAIPGYGGMESWFRWPKPIAGNARVRQRFTPSAQYQIRNLAVRLAKRGATQALVATVYDAAGQRIAIGSTPASSVPTVDTAVLSGSSLGHSWVTIPFQAPGLLLENKEYTVVLSAAAGSPYEIYPLRDGAYQYGFASPWDKGSAEYTGTAGEANWRGWDAWGKTNQPMGDLQMYFNSST